MAPKRTRAAVAKEERAGAAEQQSPSTRKENTRLTRTKSIDSLNSTGLLRNGSFTSLFRKRSKTDVDDDGNATDNNRDSVDSDVEQVAKRAKIVTKEQEEFAEREKELDAALPEELRKFRPKGFGFNLPPKDRPIRIYADGVFDLFHLGHMRQLEQCKKAFPNVTLVVGIPSDAETHKRKGLTVLTDEQRYASLRHCRWVDEVVEDAPWIVQMKFLKKHKIDYVAHDDLPYVSVESDDIYKPMKEAGMFLATQRTDGISTSDIITKIIRDYDKYLMRNFARGATRKELNVSWLKKNELDLKKQVNDFRGYFKKANENLNNTSRDLYFEVREYLRGRNSRKGRLSESPSARSSFERGTSPASEFASKYNGNKNLGIPHSKSLIDNFKEWMKKGGDLELESSGSSLGEDDEDDDDFSAQEEGKDSSEVNSEANSEANSEFESDNTEN